MSIGMGKKIKQTQQPQVGWSKAMKAAASRFQTIEERAQQRAQRTKERLAARAKDADHLDSIGVEMHDLIDRLRDYATDPRRDVQPAVRQLLSDAADVLALVAAAGGEAGGFVRLCDPIPDDCSGVLCPCREKALAFLGGGSDGGRNG